MEALRCVRRAVVVKESLASTSGRPLAAQCRVTIRGKSLKHHVAMQAIFVAWYNFARKNEALKNQTPAMANGLSDYLWTIKELIERAAG